MRLLVIGDLHFTANNKLCEMFIEQIDEYLNGVDGCVLLGDIFHTHEKINETVLNMVIRLFDIITTRCHLYVLVGNHDYRDGTQYCSNRHALSAFREWPNITIVDRPIIKKLKCGSSKIPITFCPYVPKGRFREAIDNVDWRNTHIIFCHQEFVGVKMGNIVSTDGDAWNRKYPQIVSGHIHERQNLQDNLYYPGVPYDHSYGYNGKRVITYIDFQPDTFTISSKCMKLPRRQILYMKLSDVENYKYTGHFVKIVLECTKIDFLEFMSTPLAKELKRNDVQLMYKHDETLVPENHKQYVQTSYKDTFAKLVESENVNVKNLYNEIFQ